MSDKYSCPKCYGVLNSNGFVVMHLMDHHENSGMLLLNEKLGNYDAHFSSNLKVKKGDESRLSCPCCGKSLHHDKNHSLAELIRTDANGVDSRVLFSVVYGEHSSFEIKEEALRTYGQNMLKFTDPEWFIKV